MFRQPRGCASVSNAPGGAESGARVAAAICEPQGIGRRWGRSGEVRSGPEASPELVAEAGDDALDRRIELGLGERPLVVAQGQPVGEALVGLGEGSPAVD